MTEGKKRWSGYQGIMACARSPADRKSSRQCSPPVDRAQLSYKSINEQQIADSQYLRYVYCEVFRARFAERR
jgi:hypothetical protein